MDFNVILTSTVANGLPNLSFSQGLIPKDQEHTKIDEEIAAEEMMYAQNGKSYPFLHVN